MITVVVNKSIINLLIKLHQRMGTHLISLTNDIKQVVTSVVNKYWIGYKPDIIDLYIERHVFEIGLMADLLGGVIKEKSVVDVGGGWGCFTASCTALGMNATLIDDHGDPGKSDANDPRHSLPKDFAFTHLKRDVVKEGLGIAHNSVDAITTFDMLEHLHHSPKLFLHDCMKTLKPGGVFLLGVPNSVNLRKRITVPLGRGNWSKFHHWYDEPVFRQHVREPDIHDLRKIALDMQLSNCQIIGRNWQGYCNPNPIFRTAARKGDRLLQLAPSLCSDFYLMGRKRLDNE